MVHHFCDSTAIKSGQSSIHHLVYTPPCIYTHQVIVIKKQKQESRVSLTLSLPCSSVQIKHKTCKNMNSIQHRCEHHHQKVLIESFHLSGHTFRFCWTVQDLGVFWFQSNWPLAVKEFISIYSSDRTGHEKKKCLLAQDNKPKNLGEQSAHAQASIPLTSMIQEQVEFILLAIKMWQAFPSHFVHSIFGQENSVSNWLACENSCLTSGGFTIYQQSPKVMTSQK